jgi:hypothetical protein
MTDKNTYIKVPPGSNVEITTGNEDKKDAEDLATSSSNASYSAINSSQVDKESNYNAPAESSAESNSTQESLPSDSSQGEASIHETLSKSESSNDVKNIEIKDDEKKTLKVKFKNYFKFK